jgi:glycosyltransferase involved in cell wall biosynthesis
MPRVPKHSRPRLLYVLNEAYFLLSHRRLLVEEAVRAGFDVHVAAPDDHVWAPSGFDVEQIREIGAEFHSIRISRRGQNPFRELRTLIEFQRLFSSIEPDLLHLLTIKPNLYGGLVARPCGVRGVVFAFTGLGEVFAARGAAARVRRVVVSGGLRLGLRHRNSTVIVQNGGDEELLRSAGLVRDDQIAKIRGSGVDIEEFKPSEFPAGTPVVVFAGRLLVEKGVRVFAETARAVRGSGVAARFVLVGDTHPSNPSAVPREELEDWVRGGVVEWWGRRNDMPSVFQSATIVCFPTMYGEGVPKILLEAAASGRPIVTSDIPGCREVVDHEKNGLLVSPGQSKAFADAVSYLIKHADVCRDMGAQGRRIVESNFDQRKIVRDTMDIYENLIRSRTTVGSSGKNS